MEDVKTDDRKILGRELEPNERRGDRLVGWGRVRDWVDLACVLEGRGR